MGCAQMLKTIYPFVCVETETGLTVCGSSCAMHGKEIPKEDGAALERGEREKLPPKKVYIISNELNVGELSLDRWKDVLMVYLRLGGDNTRRKLRQTELQIKEDRELDRLAAEAQ